VNKYSNGNLVVVQYRNNKFRDPIKLVVSVHLEGVKNIVERLSDRTRVYIDDTITIDTQTLATQLRTYRPPYHSTIACNLVEITYQPSADGDTALKTLIWVRWE
jgi:hypothetical protein